MTTGSSELRTSTFWSLDVLEVREMYAHLPLAAPAKACDSICCLEEVHRCMKWLALSRWPARRTPMV